MITKFNEYINESIRDAMKPKSKEELDILFKKLLGGCEVLSDFKNWISGELEEISELMKKPLNEIYYADDETPNFVEIHDYIRGMLDSISDLPKLETLEHISYSGDQCYCYPTLGVAWWNHNDEVVSWAFTKDIFKN